MAGNIFLSLYSTLRIYTGGYHANTYLKCNLYFAITFLLTIKCFDFFHGANWNNMFWGLVIVGFLIVGALAPIENKSLSVQDKIRYRKVSVSIYIVIMLIMLIEDSINYQGEVFLYFDDLVEFASLCKKYNLNLTCVTNGYIGLDYENAYKKMQLLKRNGLHNLVISYDEFHNKFLDIKAIKNLIRICNLLGIDIEIKSVILNNKYKIIDFKEDILGVPIRKIKCIRVGRAAQISSELFKREEQIYNYRCSSIVHEIAVYPNGNVFPCCSPGCMSNNKFLLGNINNNTLEECLKNIEKNNTIRDIYKYGMEDIVNKEKDIIDLCEICKYL